MKIVDAKFSFSFIKTFSCTEMFFSCKKFSCHDFFIHGRTGMVYIRIHWLSFQKAIRHMLLFKDHENDNIQKCNSIPSYS